MTKLSHCSNSPVRFGSRHKRRNHGFRWLAILLFLAGSFHNSATAGLTPTSSNVGTCAPWWASVGIGGFIATLDYKTYTALPTNSPTGLTIQYFYKVTHPLLPGYSPTCNEFANYAINNEPYGPGLNSAREVILLLIRQRIRDRVIPSIPSPTPDRWIIKQPAAVNGVRGSLDGNFFGLDLVEASPVFFIFSETLSQGEAQTNRYVPLIVESKGDEDWLELSVNGTNYFKQSLAEFETNRWYEVDVPLGSLVAGVNTYAFFLNSTGAVNSRVFFPLGEPKDRPPQIAETIVTNSIIGLNVANLIKQFDYNIEQTTDFSNWWHVTTFEATNKIQKVTFPITTNSAGFYRVVLPPQ